MMMIIIIKLKERQKRDKCQDLARELKKLWNMNVTVISIIIGALDKSPKDCYPVGWGCRIHRLHLCRGLRSPPTSFLDMTLNYLMVRFH